MKLRELKEAAKKLRLSTVGNKQALRNRLKDAMKDKESEDEESEEEEEDEGKREKESQTGGQRGEGGAVCVATQQLASFSIKDVGKSLSYFHGEDKLLIDHWIHDFEDTSVLLGWNDLQKFIYGIRMLKGVARQFISFEREIKSWDSLKRSLIREFQGKGNIEEDALIQYMVNGLLGERRDKAVLYGSRTLTEFKNNIKIFNKLKESTVQGTRFRKDNQGNVASARIGRSPAIKKDHCYGCGSEAHSYRFCPDKEKGLKCFKSNNFGHIASHCNKSQQPSENKASINCDHSTTDKVAIRINDLLAYALLDTGSEVNIINSELYNKLGRPRLYETTRRLARFGNAITKPIGRCEVNIDIEGGRYKTDVFVVSQSDMRYEVLLGRELLKELDVRINKGRVEIRRPDKRLSEEISEESVKSSDCGYVGGERRTDTDDMNANKEVEDIKATMEIKYVDTDEIDVKELYKKQEERERLRVIRLVVEKEPYEDYILENNIFMKRVNDMNVIVLPTSMQANIINMTSLYRGSLKSLSSKAPLSEGSP
ncbi:hypothetical protein M0804_009022 [Polistes exclamans]|nr:hypothetical protein M0804_009022 [Polistes exclamans]